MSRETNEREFFSNNLNNLFTGYPNGCILLAEGSLIEIKFTGIEKGREFHQNLIGYISDH